MKRTALGRIPLSWDDAQTFLAVVEHGSIAAAAKALRVNHSTVLRRIGSLEDALSARLFERFTSGYVLTASGNDFAERLSGIGEQFDAAHRSLMGEDVQIQGVIRLTSTDTLVSGLLMPLVVRFGRMHPGVQVQIVMNNNLLSLTKREADVAVRGSNRPPANLVGRSVGHAQMALYASKDYLKRLGRKATPASYVWVAPDEGLSHLAQSKWLAKNIDVSRIGLRVDSLAAMVEAVREGAGVGLLLCTLADLHPELVQLAPPDPQFDTKIWILTHPDLKQVARMRAFTHFLFEALSQEPRLGH
jgi:DNA-binding transcriptional LysR family regulator